MSFISIGSVSASLIILGVVISIVLNTNQFMESTKDEVNEIRAIIPNNLVQSDKELIKSQIKSLEGVKSVKFESKEKAFKDMKSSWGDEKYLLEGMENPLDDYFRITINNSEDNEKFFSAFKYYKKSWKYYHNMFIHSLFVYDIKYYTS